MQAPARIKFSPGITGNLPLFTRGLTGQTKEKGHENETPEEWLRSLFPAYVPHDFADFHFEFWKWVWAIKRTQRARPFLSIWPRGAAKSTNAELACVALGARRARKYVLYVSSTQDQADDHVQNIADMLSSSTVEKRYPALSERRVNQYGASKGWQRRRLRTASGFTVDAIGLDKAARGRKLEEDRPDLIIFDDIDDEGDSEHVVGRKIRALTRKILPMGSEDLVILGVQNLVHPKSIFSQLVRGTAKFLTNRIVSGPIPAIRGLDYEEDPQTGRVRITAGEATWSGLSIERCQEIIDDEGLESFLVERQHRMDIIEGVIFKRDWWERLGSRYDPDSNHIRNRVRRRYMYIDTALKDKDDPVTTRKATQTTSGRGHSYTAFVVMEVLDDNTVIVRSVWRVRLTFPGLIGAIKGAASRWNSDGLLRGIVIEDKVSGTSALQTLALQAEPWLSKLLLPFVPTGSKDERARQAASWCEFNRLVLMPEPKGSVPWLFGFLEDELFEETPEHLDRRDAFSMGIIHLERFLASKWRRLLRESGGQAA